MCKAKLQVFPIVFMSKLAILFIKQTIQQPYQPTGTYPSKWSPHRGPIAVHGHAQARHYRGSSGTLNLLSEVLHLLLEVIHLLLEVVSFPAYGLYITCWEVGTHMREVMVIIASTTSPSRSSSYFSRVQGKSTASR